MIACPVYHPALPGLFDPAVPDHPALWAVLEGRHRGRAWVDDVQHPTQCVLRTDAALTYMGRRISQAFLNEAIANFRQIGPVWLVWPPATSSQLPAPEAATFVQRLEYTDCDADAPILATWRNRLPAGFEIHPIDRQLLERCEWRSDMEFYCGSLDNFLVNGMGLCLMRGDEIIVEAYASSFGKTHAEIGAITHEGYRGHGYAPIACAYLIQACEQRGYHAYWSCDVDNPASARVARKLGFRQEKAYQVLEYSHLT